MRRIAVVAGALVIVVGLVGAGLAVASNRSGIVESRILRFAVHLLYDDSADLGPSGNSPGDMFLAHNELENFDLTKRLGHLDTACVLEDAATGLNHCTATVFLPQGKVELSARFRFTDSLQAFTIAVVGGTGRFDNVVGQATYTFGCDACPPDAHDVDTLTLRLIPSFEHP